MLYTHVLIVPITTVRESAADLNHANSGLTIVTITGTARILDYCVKRESPFSHNAEYAELHLKQY